LRVARGALDFAVATDSNPFQFTAVIPAYFITPKWNPMYFVEVIDNKGNGPMVPDLEVETPISSLA
jgi:hypothetical protein